MKILILGIGNIGSFFTEELCLENEVAIYDIDKNKLKYFMNVRRILELNEIKEFAPQLVINAVSLQHTIKAFEEILPFLPKNCVLSDVASVKTNIKDFYLKSNFKFASTHPMFGPTIINNREKNFSNEHAVIIKDCDSNISQFFENFYKNLKIKIFHYTFKEHDETVAYSLSIPFSSTIVFAACMVFQDTPGTTFKKHLDIAKCLLFENDYLIAEILFNPYTIRQLEKINSQLTYLTHIIKDKDYEEMMKYLGKLRKNILKQN